MYLTGITDEAAPDIETQILACRRLGWRYIDLRTVNHTNITSVSESEFDHIMEQLADAGLKVSSFCSSIANWSRHIADPVDPDLEELTRAIPRMRAANTRYIRVMSYQPPRNPDRETEREVIRRLKTLTRLAEDAGIVLLHENCDTWGGMSSRHTLHLLEEIDSPAFRLVFDTGNPFMTVDHQLDYGGDTDSVGAGKPVYQDTVSFYQHVRPFIEYVHIKDGRMENGEAVYTLPGDGAGSIPEILEDLHRTGYEGAFSIEPHLAVVFHDPSVTAAPEEQWRTFIDYAERTSTLLQAAGYVLPDPNPVKVAGNGAGHKKNGHRQ